MSNPRPLSIGQLSRRTGLTVRTLRHYEQLGLIDPPQRSPAGYRLYDTRIVGQLYQALALKALRLPLAQIAAQRADGLDPRQLIAQQIDAARIQLVQQQELLRRLEEVAARLRTAAAVTTDTLLQAIEVTQMFEKYFTAQQREELKTRAADLGDQIENAQQVWPRLIADVARHFDAGTPASDPHVQALAKQWVELVAQFTGGNPQLAANLTKMYQQEPQAQQQFGVRPELFAYVSAARASTAA